MFRREEVSRKGVIPSHLKERFAYLDGVAPSEHPDPWRRAGVIPVGGLWHVGFGVDPELLLVLSSAGRGVIDCAQSRTVARNEDDYYPEVGRLEAEGIGPLEGQMVRIAGIAGGGLPRTTTDGWAVALHPLSWPEEELFLCPPGQDMLWQNPGTPSSLRKLKPLPSSLVAFGFSPSGRSLVIATSSELEILRRD